MKLEQVLQDINYTLLKGNTDIFINDIKYDSRKVEKNDIYVALIGFNNDGHDYISKAIKNGAKVIVISKAIEINEDITTIKVEDTRIALAYMARNILAIRVQV